MCDQEKQREVALSQAADRDGAELSDTSSLSDSEPDEPAALFDAQVENLSSSGDSSPDREALGGVVRSGARRLPFLLRGGSAGFSSRSQSIFDGLESAAKLASPGLGEDNVIDGTFLRPMPLLPQKKKEDAREAVAGKPPLTPPASTAGQPESPVHSARWTKYSLEDVPETSNKKNSQVALEYLRSLQQRKEESLASEAQGPFIPAFNQDHSSSGDAKILFSRPGRRDGGQAAKNKAPEGCPPEGGKKKEVGLLHLEEPEEEPKTAEPSSGRGKRNCAAEEEEEEEEEGEGQQQPAVGFNSGRKVNRKKFRRGGEQEDAD